MQGTGWMVWTAIAVGSGLGGVARHLLTEAVARSVAVGFPWGTVLVNVSGSVAIGALAGMISAGGPTSWTPVARHALMTGVLGGFTTFSTFSIQTVDLLHQGQVAAAASNVLLSVVLGLVGCWAGFAAVIALGR